MRDPYKVIVWGPGGAGKAALKIMYDRPDFEIVGVLCHSFGKNGVDVGDYIRKDHMGLRISRDKDDVLSREADVVLYTGQPPFDQAAYDNDMIGILESGKNLIPITSYAYPHYHGAEYVGRLEAACQKGQSSVHGSGEMPGFFLDRMIPTLTTLCKDVEHVKIEEWFNTSQYQISTMGFFGVNKTKEEAKESSQMLGPMLLGAYAEALALVCQALWNRRPDDVTFDADFSIAEELIELPRGAVSKGKVSDLHFTFNAIIDGASRLTVVLNWTFTEPERWIIEVEGDPVSTRTEIQGFASLKDGGIMHRPGDTTHVGHYATAMPCVQAIPMVVAAPPGIVYASVFSNATPDMRGLATRTSVAG